MAVNALTDKHFIPMNGGQVMGIRIPNWGGFSFVMFKTPTCGYCSNFLGPLQTLARQEQRVRFFTADVHQFKRITGMSQTTRTPIKNVPYFVFYVGNRPRSVYKGPREIQNVLQFLNQMIAKFQHEVQGNSFVNQPQQQMQRPMPQQQMPQQQMPAQYPQQQGRGRPQQGQYGPTPTRGMVNAQMAMQGNKLGPTMTQQDLQRQHDGMEARDVPEGIIPHNAPWVNYQTLDLQY